MQPTPTQPEMPRVVRVATAPPRAAHDTIVPVAIRCAWCSGWMSAPSRPAELPVSHGLCPGCREHLCGASAHSRGRRDAAQAPLGGAGT